MISGIVYFVYRILLSSHQGLFPLSQGDRKGRPENRAALLKRMLVER